MKTRVQVYRVQEMREAGWPVAGGEVLTMLYDGPAEVSGPTLAWEKAAALEGQVDAILLVHTGVDLQDAGRAVVGLQEYQVVGVTRAANDWRLTLRRRR